MTTNSMEKIIQMTTISDEDAQTTVSTDVQFIFSGIQAKLVYFQLDCHVGWGFRAGHVLWTGIWVLKLK